MLMKFGNSEPAGPICSATSAPTDGCESVGVGALPV
jgi:hypothetical protein